MAMLVHCKIDVKFRTGFVVDVFFTKNFEDCTKVDVVFLPTNYRLLRLMVQKSCAKNVPLKGCC